jgi:hypothetical protein
MIKRLLLLLVAVGLTACGVPTDSSPRSLPTEVLDALNSSEPAEDTGGELAELWFVRDEKIAPVERRVEQLLSPEETLLLLEAGPTAEEKEAGLRTALVPVVADTPLVATAAASGLTVPAGNKQTAVVLDDQFSELPSEEQLLILGQVVFTLAPEPDESVLFVNSSGTPIGVPLPNGRLSSGAVNRSNYEALRG